MLALWLVILIIFLALVFDFLNGANDRANAIATVTATKALTPVKALILASVFNLAGACVSTRVAETIGKGIILPDDITLVIIAAGVFGAVVWVFICTSFGIPISVSHSLVGGLLGAGIAAGGFGIINWEILNNKVFLAIVLGPFAGFIVGALLFSIISWLLYLFFQDTPATETEGIFKKLQIISASFMAYSHGMNDTQNAMGVITIALLAGGIIPVFDVPLWVKLSCGLMMALGTFVFGWRVMKTLGWRLTKLEPKHGFAAETGAGLAVVGASLTGMPVSTTHVIGSAVIGGTFFQSLRRIRWSEVEKMVIAWVITIPLAALIGGAVYRLVLLGL
ncbi:MAG: inorganic phosphate transporter [Methanophagales archaeon]|nr:inorganic phosphate transporter [Methanophagales archaeon]RLG32489.1 MAG: inorganic phosphate transporter [Methanosarcinales archaeon]